MGFSGDLFVRSTDSKMSRTDDRVFAVAAEEREFGSDG